MSIATQLSVIQTDTNSIRAKYIELGLAQTSDGLDKLAAASENIENRGAVSAEVKEGETYTIPKGYHNGSGTVSGVQGGGNYKLQSKTVTPTKKEQNVTPDDGNYGLSDVTVAAIPESYQDVSAVTAAAENVLAGKVIVDAAGVVATGTMPNNGGVTRTLTADEPAFTVPAGYHSGEGEVKIVPESKTVTPAKAAQNIAASEGKVLSGVTVEAIPDNFVDTSDADAAAGNILMDKTAYVNGEKVTGSMPANGDVSKTMDGLTVTSVEIPAGYTSGGTVSLTDGIEKALAAIRGVAV